MGHYGGGYFEPHPDDELERHRALEEDEAGDREAMTNTARMSYPNRILVDLGLAELDARAGGPPAPAPHDADRDAYALTIGQHTTSVREVERWARDGAAYNQHRRAEVAAAQRRRTTLGIVALTAAPFAIALAREIPL